MVLLKQRVASQGPKKEKKAFAAFNLKNELLNEKRYGPARALNWVP